MSLELTLDRNNALHEANQQAIATLTAANEKLTAAVGYLTSIMEQMLAGASALRSARNTEFRISAEEPAPEVVHEATKDNVYRRPEEIDADESEYSRRARGVPAEETRDEPKKRHRRTKEQIAADNAREAAEKAREEDERNASDHYDYGHDHEPELPLGKAERRDEPKPAKVKAAAPVEIDERTFRLRCREFATTKRIEIEDRDDAIAKIKAHFGATKIVEVNPDHYAQIMWAFDKFENGDRVNFREYDEDQALNEHGRDGDDI